MSEFIKRIFGRNTEPQRGFSDFFAAAPTSTKIDLLQRVVREANKDQKRVVDEMSKSVGRQVVRQK